MWTFAPALAREVYRYAMTIGLVMIMKNESKVIRRCLESVYKIIDHFTVVDTGSDDGSADIVRNFFAEKNILGDVYDFPCKEDDEGYLMFDQWRTFAVEKAKGKTDFCFTLDADETIVLPKNFQIHQIKSQLAKTDIGMVDLDFGSSMYNRRAFWRNSKPFRYFCPVHEVLLCDAPTAIANIKGISVKVESDGNSWKQDLPKKYLGHAKSLLRYIEKNGEEPRAIFYLAQSYKDAGEKELAIEWYEKRAAMTSGFYEERYWAQYMVAQLKWDLKAPISEVADEFMKCCELDDLRAEHLHQLKYLYERCGRSKSALKVDELWRKYIGRNPYPQRGLFINPEAYRQYVPPPKKTLDDLFDSITSAWVGHRDFATWLVNEMKPKVILDLGVDWGYSTFALAVPNIGKVYGIDHFEGDPFTGIRNTYNEVMANVKWLRNKHNISNIEIIKGQFDDVAKRWNPKNKIDILHIDEVPSDIGKDYDTWIKYLSDDGVILFHNTQAFGEVKNFFANLDLAKYEFNHSGGLGVASRNQAIIDCISEKYSPKLVLLEKMERITIAYIAYDTEVFNKYLHPSLQNLRGEFDTICLNSKDNMPAKNYNHMLEMSNNRYILFVHEDTTFSPDFLERMFISINKFPEFGAIGAVGNYQNNIHWSRMESIMEVKTLDCCCILVNKENNIRFDEKTFDDYHLYVDDYCLQANAKGLKNYTIPIDAAEAGKDEKYRMNASYFRHHSATVNKLGYCWGRYNEYLQRMDEKWKPISIENEMRHEVDVCIVSNAKTDILKKVTENGIRTLLKSEENIIFNIFVVESNRMVKYDFPNTQTIYPSIAFNYNAYLNMARMAGKSDYVFLANNDLIYEKNWATNIIMAMKKNPMLLSASPFCPQIQNKKDFPDEIYYGYMIRKELLGWAIFQQRKIYDFIEKIDEGVNFWFSDNLIADQLMLHKIPHALITTSIVNHHGNNLGITGSSTLDRSKMDEYTTGQYQKYLKAKERLFNSNKVVDFYV